MQKYHQIILLLLLLYCLVHCRDNGDNCMYANHIIVATSININSLAATKSKQWHSLQMFVYKYLLKSDPIDHVRILGVIGTETDITIEPNAGNLFKCK